MQTIIPLTELEHAVAWARSMPLTVDHDQDVRMAGVRLSLDGTPRIDASVCRDQEIVLAAYRESLAQAELRRARRSNYFGKAGDKKMITVELTVSRVKPVVGEWGRRTYFWFRDATDGRLVRWLQSSGRPVELVPGQRVRLTGRVKAHENGGAEPITVMTFCTAEVL